MLINYGFISERKSQVSSDWSIFLALIGQPIKHRFRGRIYEKKTTTETRNAACHFDPEGDIDHFEG